MNRLQHAVNVLTDEDSLEETEVAEEVSEMEGEAE